MQLADLPQRIIDRVEPEPNTGCWLWSSVSRNGYGSIQIKGVSFSAHRYVYRTLVGDPGRDLDLDHTCRVKSCVNPLHLEPVTHIENLRRGVGTASRARTHCGQGHPFSAENTFLYRGKRMCRECGRIRCRRYKQEIKQGLRTWRVSA